MRALNKASLGRLATPSFADWFFVALIAWLFIAGSGWAVLLADGDTGWHIRTGELILDRGGLPRTDPFSFTRAGERWYAWEWGADVLFALCHRTAGLKGVVLLAGALIALYLTLLLRHMVWRGANAFVALAVCLLGAGASGIHFLARPHVFTLALFAIALWLLESDRRRPHWTVWLLVPLTGVWVNLHAGFLALLVTLAAQAAGEWIESGWRAARRKLVLLAACATATLANPYGAALHRHVAEYLRSDWIREAVDEFQSPKFRSESALQFEILLFVGLVAVWPLLKRRKVADALVVLVWAHAALVSVRHVPVFVVAAGPILAEEVSRWWAGWTAGRPARTVSGILNRMAADFTAGFARTSLWPVALLAALLLVGAPLRWPRDFPEVKFPTGLIGRHAGTLAGARVFTSDQWGDYLLYRFYPAQRVFIDGRSDFYGPQIGKLYLRMAYGHGDWRGALDRCRIQAVLAPKDWPLAGILAHEPGWRMVEDTVEALLFERAAAAVEHLSGLKETPLVVEIPRGGQPHAGARKGFSELSPCRGEVARGSGSAKD